MTEAEAQSGRSFEKLIAGRASQKLLALWVHERRSNSGKPRSWQELSSLRHTGHRPRPVAGARMASVRDRASDAGRRALHR